MNIYIETLGCPKNIVDSEIISGVLKNNGYQLVDQPKNADIILVNTCGFINDAKEESIHTILTLSQYKKEKCKVLMVSGCLSERYGEELFKEMPEIDILMGVNDYENILEIISKARTHKRELYNSVCTNTVLDMNARALSTPQYTAYLKIAEGCDNYCSYCIIPYIRGSYRSRAIMDILQEAKRLVQEGIKEITLVAQDVTNYGIDLYDTYKIHELVQALSQIEDLKWIRLMYCYPHLITDELIEVIAQSDNVCKYIDIPIQHCSDSMLKKMNRKGNKEKIISVIHQLRKEVPNIHIRTSLIVGLPGETEKDFEELKQFVEDMKFERLGVFEYSPEEGTTAAKMDNQIDDRVKSQRRDELMRIQQSIAREINNKKKGKKIYVLVEEKVQDEDVYIGRTQYDAYEIDNSVIFTSNRLLKPGNFVRVKITDALEYDLIGEDINEPAQ